MSGVEVVGLISAIIGIIEAITNVYNGLKDAKNLPPAFRKVAERLPLVRDTLRVAEKQIEANADEEACQAIKIVMEKCRVKAEHLEDIFKAVAPSEGTSRLERYRMAARRLGKGNLVEVLTKEMMEDVRLLADNRAVQAATEAQVAQLLDAIKELSGMEPSLPDEDSFVSMSHFGSGDNVAGNNYNGNHNVFSGSGTANFGPVTNHVRVMTEVKRVPRQECLKSLSFPQMNDRTNDIDGVAEGTCGWLFQDQTYTAWVSGPGGLLCIKGKPGSGKSTLLRYALDKIKETPNTGERVFLSFFFHGHGTELQRTPVGLFRSLLYQLLSQVPDALPDLVATFQHRCETMGKPGKKWQWHPHELRRFFKSSLPKVLETRQVWLFVDALYECGEMNAAKLAEDFKSLPQRLHSTGLKQLRACFTCRHYPNLGLDGKSTILLDTKNKQDIVAFVRAHISTEHPNTDVGRLIIEHSRGVFMWARLVLERVLLLLNDGESTAKIKAEIGRIPEDLNCLYDEIIKAVKYRSDRIELMQWICFSMRPLTTDELRWAMAVDPDCTYESLNERKRPKDFITPDKVEDKIKALSCGLVEIVPSYNAHIVQFIHPSVNDFLVEGGLMALYNTTKPADLVVPAAHCCLSRCCIRYLQMTVFSPSAPLSKEDKSRYPFLHYATTSWIFHAKFGDAAEASPGDLLDLLGRWPKFIESWVEIYQRIEPFARDCPSAGSNLVHVASRYGLTRLLSCLLLEAGKVDIDARDKNGQTPLSWAARNGYEAVVKLLLDTDKVDIDARDRNGQTPLSRAAENGQEAVVKLLVGTGKVDTGARDNYDWTPLSRAAENGRGAVVKLLLDTDKVDVDVRDTVYGQTPLSRAAENGHEAVVKLLLDTDKVDVDARDKNGQTPLSRAAENGQEAVVKLLLDTDKVDVDVRDTVYGQTPLSRAARNGHEAVVELLLDTDMVDVDVRDTVYGQTPLSRAAENGHEAVVKLLLDTDKVDVDARDKNGQTPLSRAAENGHETVAKLLSDAGQVDVNARDIYLWFALWGSPPVETEEFVTQRTTQPDDYAIADEASSEDEDGAGEEAHIAKPVIVKAVAPARVSPLPEVEYRPPHKPEAERPGVVISAAGVAAPSGVAATRENRSRESGSSRSDKDGERHRRLRHSHRSHHSSRSRDEEGEERRSRGDDERRPRFRIAASGSGTPGTPPRTQRPDSGFSADASSGSSGRRRRTTEEQAAHAKRKVERAQRRASEKEAERKHEPSRLREPKEVKETKEIKDKKPEPEPEPERRHRHSHRTRDDPPESKEPEPSRQVRVDTEDALHRARHKERREALAKEDEKKPGGIKSAFKKLFGGK